jgi:hypothetical protein
MEYVHVATIRRLYWWRMCRRAHRPLRHRSKSPCDLEVIPSIALAQASRRELCENAQAIAARSSIMVTGALMTGQYEKLYQYLEGRFANVVVLTFAQIEDLLGFVLPPSARADQGWWANPEPNDAPSPHARSWILATRIATPNMRAQTVTFEREQR